MQCFFVINPVGITGYSTSKQKTNKQTFRLNWPPLHLHRNLNKLSHCWRRNEINASFKHMFVQCFIIVPFLEYIITSNNSALTQDLIFRCSCSFELCIKCIAWKLTSGWRKWIFSTLLIAKRYPSTFVR